MKGINRFINTSELAERYYNIVKPGRYNRTGALKQIVQDRHLDKKILVKLINEMNQEAIACLGTISSK